MPNFFVIGAGRSGTTSLHNYLSQHPDIFMTEMKEPSYFAFEDERDLGRGARSRWLRDNTVLDEPGYLGLFAHAGAEKFRGESSPRYLETKTSPGRILKAVPEARMVVMLRHPVDRCFAQYNGEIRDGWGDGKSFADSLVAARGSEGVDGPYSRRVEIGFYHRHLRHWLEHFPRDRFCIQLFDDFASDPLAVARNVFGFLGVDVDFQPDVSRQFNQSGMIRNPVIRFLWTRSNGIRWALRPYLPKTMRDRVYHAAVRNVEKQTLPGEARTRLLQIYREDTLELQDLLDRDLSKWLK
jgi:hypothetical protein